MAVAPQPNVPVGYDIPIGFNPQTGLPQGQGIPPLVQQNQVRYQASTAGMPAGMPESLKQAYAMQQLGPNPPSASQMSSSFATPGTTQATAPGAPAYFDPTWYVQNNPDVLAGFNSQKDQGEGMAWYGNQHYGFSAGDGGNRYLGPNDPAYLARTQYGLSTAAGTKPSDTQMEMFNKLSPEDQINLINFLKGQGLA